MLVQAVGRRVSLQTQARRNDEKYMLRLASFAGSAFPGGYERVMALGWRGPLMDIGVNRNILSDSGSAQSSFSLCCHGKFLSTRRCVLLHMQSSSSRGAIWSALCLLSHNFKILGRAKNDVAKIGE